MAVSQIEKSTLDAVKYYLTQKRGHQNEPIAAMPMALGQDNGNLSPGSRTPAKPITNFKDLMDSECEACT